MKKNFDLKTKIELNVDDMVDIACRSCLQDYESNSKAKKLILAAMKNKKEIAETIKQSQSRKLANVNGGEETHCIALVDGKARVLKSLLAPSESVYWGEDRIMFVYEKSYTRYNYMDFHKDVFFHNGEGLDSVWCDFPYVYLA